MTVRAADDGDDDVGAVRQSSCSRSRLRSGARRLVHAAMMAGRRSHRAGSTVAAVDVPADRPVGAPDPSHAADPEPRSPCVVAAVVPGASCCATPSRPPTPRRLGRRLLGRGAADRPAGRLRRPLPAAVAQRRRRAAGRADRRRRRSRSVWPPTCRTRSTSSRKRARGGRRARGAVRLGRRGRRGGAGRRRSSTTSTTGPSRRRVGGRRPCPPTS